MTDPTQAPGLARLLGVDDVDDFRRRFWPDGLFLAEGPVSRLAGLVDLGFDALLEADCQYLNAWGRTLDGASKMTPIERRQARNLYEAGFTIYLHKLRTPAIDRWAAAIDTDLGLGHGITMVNAFASRRGLGFPFHYDHTDIFVCQGRGAKEWKVAPNAHVQYPSIGFKLGEPMTPARRAESPNGRPPPPASARTIRLTPGSVLFMPRGTWHTTETVDEESLHFNVMLGVPTWKDALEFLLFGTTALVREELDQPVARLFEGDAARVGVVDELGERLRRTVEAISAEKIEVSKEAFLHFVARRRSGRAPD